ncbi:MAG: DUF6475 domain-containing protein [Myxococcota bacterium]
MQPQDRASFMQDLEGLCAAFGREADKATLHGYFMGLEDMPIDAFRAACRRAVRECKFMPKPAELRQLGGELNGSSRALSAWQELERALSSVGSYQSVDFEDPAINAAVRGLGGWVYLCQRETEELNRFIQPRFMKAYESYFDNGVGGDAGRYLPGIAETHNAAKNFEVAPPVFVSATEALPARLLSSGRSGTHEIAHALGERMQLPEAS